MFTISPMKISELIKIANVSSATVSVKFKNAESPDVYRKNNRISGLSPEIVDDYLQHHKHGYLSRDFIYLVNSQVGGTGKTSCTISLATCARRMTSRKKAIVIIDLDSQASTTLQVCGVVDDENLTLVDYIENRATLDQILTPVISKEDNYADNTYIIKSNLNNLYLDKAINIPKTIRYTMYQLFQEIFTKFPNGCKIFIDSPPALSNSVSSSICGMAQLKDVVDSKVITPLRNDLFSLQGASISVREKDEILKTFNLPKIESDIFFSSFDRRSKISSQVMKTALGMPTIKDYISPVVVRFSSEMSKTSFRHENIFSEGKINNITSDYLDLYLSIMGYCPNTEA